MDLSLKNKLAAITGGGVGIGLAVAETFASEGANVLIIARGSAYSGRPKGLGRR